MGSNLFAELIRLMHSGGGWGNGTPKCDILYRGKYFGGGGSPGWGSFHLNHICIGIITKSKN